LRVDTLTERVVADSGGDNSDRLVQSWRANAARWSNAVRDGKIVSRRAVTDGAIVSAVLRHQPSSVLDLGCGEGWLCKALAPNVPRCVGIDASPELIETARQSGPADYAELSYSALIANPTGVGTGFDIIVANFSLLDECTEELVVALSQAARTDGRLVIQTVHPWSVGGEYRTGWRTERFESFGSEEWTPMPWFFRTIENWISVFGEMWRLERIEEPRMDDHSFPVSLIMTASKGPASSRD
jgi:2-polyprenyl-3-methyl-5-hydroxy-6-metoxy-1,4-benzoquinol methylase